MRKWWITVLAVILLVPVIAVDTARASSIGDEIVSKAKEYQGVPYQFGGTTTSGFDCSGFVRHVFRDFGVELPRTASLQQGVGTYVAKSDLQPGDIVYFANTYQAGISHNGIYIGNNKFIGSQSSTGVAVTSLNSSYWGPRYHSAKRVITDPKKEVASETSMLETLPRGEYYDVSDNHRSQVAIQYLSEREIINGFEQSLFKPDGSITRAQAAMMITRYFNFTADSTIDFADVSTNMTGYEHIQAIASNGIMEGYSNGNFGPNDEVTRDQIAAILDRAFDFENETTTANITKSFTDVSEDDWSYNYIMRLTETGVISGFEDNSFRPGDNTTRAQFSELLYRSIQH
jgi:hypothetical protein